MNTLKMEKKIYIIILSMVLVMGSATASVCQDETEISDIPCVVITPVLSCSDNASVLNIDTLQQFNHTIYPVGDGTYNFTFNYSIGSYSIILCDQTTGSINIIPDLVVQDINLGGAGISAPDPSQVIKALEDETKKKIDDAVSKYGKTTKILFWLVIIAFIFSVLALANWRKRRLDKLADKVADRLSL